MDKLQESSRCVICLDCLCEPITPKCGHTFCYKCIKRYTHSLLRQYRPLECPNRRHEFNQDECSHVNITMRDIIENLCKLGIVSRDTEQEEQSVPIHYVRESSVPITRQHHMRYEDVFRETLRRHNDEIFEEIRYRYDTYPYLEEILRNTCVDSRFD